MNVYTDEEIKNVLSCYACLGDQFDFDSMEFYAYPAIYNIRVDKKTRSFGTAVIIQILMDEGYITHKEGWSDNWYRKTQKAIDFLAR